MLEIRIGAKVTWRVEFGVTLGKPTDEVLSLILGLQLSRNFEDAGLSGDFLFLGGITNKKQ